MTVSQAISVPVPKAKPHGITPVEFNVLVEPVEIERKTKGGIILADETREKEQAAAVHGRIVAVSPLAFSYDDWPAEQRPKPGDKVVFAKYAGMTVRGADDREYRLVKDKDICAVTA